MTIDATTTAGEVQANLGGLVDHLVDEVPGVLGALVSSADGFVLISRLPPSTPLSTPIDPAAVAAMSAATLGLSSRLVELVGQAPIDVSIQRTADAQVLVFGISHIAALTVFARSDADLQQLQLVGREIVNGLFGIFQRAADR